jgi:hypothetical protein
MRAGVEGVVRAGDDGAPADQGWCRKRAQWKTWRRKQELRIRELVIPCKSVKRKRTTGSTRTNCIHTRTRYIYMITEVKLKERSLR